LRLLVRDKLRHIEFTARQFSLLPVSWCRGREQ